MFFIREGHVDDAKEISNFITPYLYQNDYFSRNRKLFTDGIIMICEGNIDEGKIIAENTIEVFKLMDETLSQDYRKELDNVLDNLP